MKISGFYQFFLLLLPDFPNFHIYLFLLDSFGQFVASQFVPHFLKLGILLHFLPVVRPVKRVLVLSVSENSSPVLIFQMVLDLSNILVGVIEDVDGLSGGNSTSLLS